MRHEVYFLIDPTEAARREFPLRADPDLAMILLDYLLTSRAHYGSYLWGEEEGELVVKLLHLARMREYDGLSDSESAMRILGSDRISVDVFDQWWTIRRLEMEEGPSEDMHDFLIALVDSVIPTGNDVVDDWVKQLPKLTSSG
ncbi:hypothetical protein [Massilia antarctica]|uniref:hypothetical protein n=1 Tax=Massilia antarctica TaxID=2765360 RepID=UPI0006BD0C3D|nr:hypothetical protein [Massilia sp. H27-R4]MCY0912883.1 hypothetical protein [Massilia sp. H27-R4]CUI07458.1 hypothetical protein BN2497_9693 [Janthinobacterium sp. CG23_2]CUU31244.1 hypothetical protein BN3177_9693 [Janthinobacterium sp. CG23_2]